jgi:hypothetical protein
MGSLFSCCIYGFFFHHQPTAHPPGTLLQLGGGKSQSLDVLPELMIHLSIWQHRINACHCKRLMIVGFRSIHGRSNGQ